MDWTTSALVLIIQQVTTYFKVAAITKSNLALLDHAAGGRA